MKTSENPYPPAIVMRLVRNFAFVLSRVVWSVEFRGTENIPPDAGRGLVVAPNHQTYLDPFWIIIPIKRRFRFMAWDKAFGWFGIGGLIRYLGAFPVDIERGDKEAYQKSIEVLREGATLVIFPEGSRALADGELLDFKTGAVRMALEAGVPVLPVTLRGANRVWGRGIKRPRLFRKISVVYHPPLEIPPPAAGADEREHVRALTEKLKTIIAQDL